MKIKTHYIDLSVKTTAQGPYHIIPGGVFNISSDNWDIIAFYYEDGCKTELYVVNGDNDTEDCVSSRSRYLGTCVVDSRRFSDGKDFYHFFTRPEGGKLI